jgi:aconitate hydratase
MFAKRYADVFKGDEQLARPSTSPAGETFAWDRTRPTCPNPPYFDGMTRAGAGHRHRRRARAGLLGDSVTTDHISPAGSIKPNSPAAST